MKRVLIGLALIGILVGAAFALSGCAAPGASGAKDAAATAQIPPVEAGNDVVAEAVVKPVRSVQLGLPTGGIVREVLVAEGDQVQTDQLLLTLNSAREEAAVTQAEAQLQRAMDSVAEVKAGARPEEVASAQAAVAAAQAQLARVQQGAKPEDIAAAEAALNGARASLKKVQEGPREEELIAARSELANAEATLRQAQTAYDRVKFDPNILARSESLQLEQATNAYTAAKARLAALKKGATAAEIEAARAQVAQAQAQLEALKAPAREAEIAAAEAEIQRAQAQLELLQAGARPETVAAAEAEVAAAEAAVEQARAVLADLELRAPFAGTIASLDAKVGEQVGPGAPVVSLADLSAWQIETDDLTELNIVKVREGDPVLITFDAIPDLELPGKVVRIKPIGENKMGDMTYTAIIAPDRNDERMRWNMTASVAIEPQ